ncbi:MAG TPA: hypothetical protein VFB20_01265 [Burkholderiales bacterium]|nr:hypothetical protein [Burkholderiales bacterium]
MRAAKRSADKDCHAPGPFIDAAARGRGGPHSASEQLTFHVGGFPHCEMDGAQFAARAAAIREGVTSRRQQKNFESRNSAVGYAVSYACL